MALPPGLFQIKGRRGFYANIPVPRDLKREINKAIDAGLAISVDARMLRRKGTIQKKLPTH